MNNSNFDWSTAGGCLMAITFTVAWVAFKTFIVCLVLAAFGVTAPFWNVAVVVFLLQLIGIL